MKTDNKQLTKNQNNNLQEYGTDQIPETTFLPSTDIVETDKEMKIYLDMPGVEKEKLSIKLEKGVISLNGEVNFSNVNSFKTVRSEYRIGNFSRSFRLGNKIDQTKIDAKYDDGVLVVSLPKLPEAQPKFIEIN